MCCCEQVQIKWVDKGFVTKKKFTHNAHGNFLNMAGKKYYVIDF